jgi:eukaryotic-like serine/threonine-protein kinase
MVLHGERLDRPSYAILRSMRDGSSGDVVLADHLVFGRKCVQKTYSTIGLEDAAAHNEPRLLHEIQHDHVAEVLEAQYDPDKADSITFVCVYYEGGSIERALSEGYRFSLHQAVRIATQILDALAFVHNNPKLQIVHRDVKPGNVFLDAARTYARLGDWGSAARMEADGSVAGTDGTPLYTPPEAGPSDGRMTTTGDLYSTAFTLFEMLNGPLDYATIDPAEVDRRLSRGLRARPGQDFVFAPHVPAALRTAVRRGLRAKPSERDESASRFIARLQGVSCIDWTHGQGSGLDGKWVGTWPPGASVARRRTYLVTSRVLRGGGARGRRRVEARQALPGSDRIARFGVDDVTLDADDRAGMDRFFSAVEASAAQRVPAR